LRGGSKESRLLPPEWIHGPREARDVAYINISPSGVEISAVPSAWEPNLDALSGKDKVPCPRGEEERASRDTAPLTPLPRSFWRARG
jgi:hypothetical protein